MVEPNSGRRLRRSAALALTLTALVGCAGLGDGGAAEGDQATTAEEGAEPVEGVPYDVAIEGVEEPDLAELLDQVSESRRLIERPPSSMTRLRARAEADRPRLQQALRSRGYYAAEVAVAIDPERSPPLVTFDVDPGPVYRLEEITIESEPPGSEVALPTAQDLGLEPGQPAVAERILEAQAALLAAVRGEGYALAEAGERRAVVDHDRSVMSLTLRVVPGPQVRFGPISIRGLESVDADFVRRRLPWQQGELITTERLDEGRRALRETDLFNSIVFDLGGTADQNHRMPVEVVVTERKHRSITAGARYRTDEGPGGSVGWIHRNLFGHGERFEAEADVSGIGAFADGSFRKPDVIRRNLAFITNGRIAYEDTEAYKSRSAGGRVGLEYTFAERKIILTGAVAYKAENVDDKSGSEGDGEFGLVSLPLRLDWDTSDDRLDPSEGGRLRVYDEPFADTLGEDLQFNKSRLDYTHYFQVLDEPQIVLAGRGAIGTLFGASREDVPATERFYAGGGGSVRGFGYQLAGELDEDDKPLGGRSLIELSGEVRVRITETIGAAAFVDAGTVYDSEVPSFDEPLRVGVGPGLRYFSPIGPLRADLGFPLDPRDSDDAFQFYISLGQAF